MIVDFTNVPVGQYVLGNVGPDACSLDCRLIPKSPIPDNRPDHAVPRRAGGGCRPDHAAPVLQLPAIAPLPTATVTRRLALLEEMSMFFADAPAAAMLGTVAGDPDA